MELILRLLVQELYPNMFLLFWMFKFFSFTGSDLTLSNSYLEVTFIYILQNFFLHSLFFSRGYADIEHVMHKFSMPKLQNYKYVLLVLKLSKKIFDPGMKNFVDEEGFRNAIYTFDIGQNDLAGAFSSNLSYDQIIQRIPSYLAEIKFAIWVSLLTYKFVYNNALLQPELCIKSCTSSNHNSQLILI